MGMAGRHDAGAGDAVARIVSLRGLERELDRDIDAARLAEVDAIFFAASNTQQFSADPERDAFHERWLGRYLQRYRPHFFLALDTHGRIIGYLAGCLDDPARHFLFADIAYFSMLSDLTSRYPAHLHVNLHADWRQRGIGARLVEAFCAHAMAGGSPGVHVVTGQGARNEHFYARCGFHPLRAFTWNASRLIILGRALT